MGCQWDWPEENEFTLKSPSERETFRLLAEEARRKRGGLLRRFLRRLGRETRLDDDPAARYPVRKTGLERRGWRAIRPMWRI